MKKRNFLKTGLLALLPIPKFLLSSEPESEDYISFSLNDSFSEDNENVIQVRSANGLVNAKLSRDHPHFVEPHLLRTIYIQNLTKYAAEIAINIAPEEDEFATHYDRMVIMGNECVIFKLVSPEEKDNPLMGYALRQLHRQRENPYNLDEYGLIKNGWQEWPRSRK